jgi:hypothetical protein
MVSERRDVLFWDFHESQVTNHECTVAFNSAINLLAVSDAENQHQQAVVFDLADEAERADAVSPELTQAGALQSLANASRIFQSGKPFPKKFQNAPGVLRIELAEFAVSLGGKFNPPGHDALRRLPAE